MGPKSRILEIYEIGPISILYGKSNLKGLKSALPQEYQFPELPDGDRIIRALPKFLKLVFLWNGKASAHTDP